jgi:hypothetical protein
MFFFFGHIFLWLDQNVFGKAWLCLITVGHICLLLERHPMSCMVALSTLAACSMRVRAVECECGAHGRVPWMGWDVTSATASSRSLALEGRLCVP